MEVRASLTYTKVRAIGSGEGRNSEVFLVDEPQLGGRLAIKEIAKANLQTDAVSGFFAEAQAMFASEHPNIVPLKYACETDDEICLAMPYFPRGSLQSRIETQPLSVVEAIRIADGVLAGLGQVHSRRYIHFDIKPTNVLFSQDDTPMLADFGQSRMVFRGLGFAHAPPMYYATRPPEVLRDGVGSVASDIYQVGLLIWRIIIGEREYRNHRDRHSDLAAAIGENRFPPRSSLPPHICRQLGIILRKSLKPDPADRFQSAQELRQALAKVKVVHDWQPHEEPTATEWSAERVSQPRLVVRLQQTGNRHWGIQTFTESPRGRRAIRKGELWSEGHVAKASALKQVGEVLRKFEP